MSDAARFGGAAAISACLSIAGALLGAAALAGVFKVTTTILIIAFAWRRSSDGFYARAILFGLVASLAGDAFLIAPWGFLPGLVSFLIAHLAYLYAFTGGLRRGFSVAPALGYTLFVAIALSFLWPGVPDALRVPVVVYIAALATMAAMAASLFLRTTGDGAARALARFAAIGGALFVASDATLAFNKFAGPVPLSALWILAAYWLAQWLIALSVTPARR